MHLSKIYESLDDKDEFTRHCYTCTRVGANPQIDLERFHRDHIEAASKASRDSDVVTHFGDKDMLYTSLYHKEMEKRGWEWNAYDSNWMLSESLDDKDEFMTTNCIHCNEQYKSETGKSAYGLDRPDTPINTDMEDFHRVHTIARQKAWGAGAYGSPEYKSRYEDIMNNHSYYYVRGVYGSHWVKEW
jgi:hypothetical protein